MSRTVIIAAGFVGYMVLLIPYWLGYHPRKFAHSQFRDAVTSATYGRTVFAFMVSTVPLLLDTLLDFFQRFSSKSTNNYVLGRFIYAAVTFISSVLLVLINIYPDLNIFTTDPVLNYLIVIFGLRIGTASAMMYILASVSPNICGVVLPLLITLYVSGCFCTRFYYLSIHHGPFFHSITMLSFLLVFIIVVYIYWSIRLYHKRKTMTLHDYSMIMYMIIFVATYIGTYAMVIYRMSNGTLYAEVSNSTTIDISSTALSYLVSTVLMIIVPGRIARLEASNNLKTIIDTKKSYVRYISHELRTPMNTVYMGINLCIDDGDTDTDSGRSIETTSGLDDIVEEKIDSFRCMNMSEKEDILKDTSVACNAAIDILNDLLLYDKVENDMMVLNKTKVPIAELVHDSLKMFNIQYRHRRIELVIENGSPLPRKSNREIKKSGSCSCHSRHFENTKVNDIESAIPSNVSKRSLEIYDNSVIHEEDMMELDKAKMIQVIRNVMSNALKFTPEGGQIYVNIRYEEGDMSSTSSTTGDIEKNMLSVILTYVNGIRVWLFQQFCLVAHTVSCGRMSTDIFDSSSSDILPDQNVNKCKLNTFGNKGYFVMTIRDTGAGISEVNQSQLFHNIIQFKPEILQHGGGSGLGLYISKSIVDKHHGTIDVYSAGEGQGTTFTIKLPMTRRPLSKSMISSDEYNRIEVVNKNVESVRTKKSPSSRELSSSFPTIKLPMIFQQSTISTLSNNQTIESIENITASVDIKKSTPIVELIYQDLYTASQHGVRSTLPSVNNANYALRDDKSSELVYNTCTSITNFNTDTLPVSIEPSPNPLEKDDTYGNDHYESYMTVTEENLRNKDISCTIKKNHSTKNMMISERSMPESTYLHTCTSGNEKVDLDICADLNDKSITTNTVFNDRNTMNYQDARLYKDINTGVTEDDSTSPLNDTIVNSNTSSIQKMILRESTESIDCSVKPFHQKYIVNSLICDDFEVSDIGQQFDDDKEKDTTDNDMLRSTVITPIKSHSYSFDSSVVKEATSSLIQSTAIVPNSINTYSHADTNIDSHQSLQTDDTSLRKPTLDIRTLADSPTMPPSNLLIINSSPQLAAAALSRNTTNIGTLRSSARSSRTASIGNSTIQSTRAIVSKEPLPRRLHVLIVDDSSMNRKMMARLLSSVHYTYNEAGDGVEAVQIMTQSMKRHPYNRQISDQVSDVVSGQEPVDKTYEKFLLKPFDVILMDFMMPNMDGPTATAEIRKLGYTGPIYGVTGNAQQFDIDHFIEKGADKVFVKPLILSELTKELKSQFTI